MRVEIGTRWALMALGLALGGMVLATGCATRNIAKDRSRVVEAEAVDANQRATVAEREAKDIQLRYDRQLAQEQVVNAKLSQAEGQASLYRAQAARGQAAEVQLAHQADATRLHTAQVNQLQAEVGNLLTVVEQYRKEFAERNAENKPNLGYHPSKDLEAFRRDLASRLHAQGIDLPVELRTSTSGEQQVAVVLRGAFKAGKHSIAHSMESVKAVVWLGELVSRDYAGSRIRVEGHTDSDPLNKSKALYKDNYDLSLQRAGSVQDLLIKAGVSASAIETVGMGPDAPLESGTSKRAKSMNRRVDIYILPAA